jgi:hypothetical protein
MTALKGTDKVGKDLIFISLDIGVLDAYRTTRSAGRLTFFT